ncbi:Hypothetical protein SMAX5B_018298 [Scophthalmus maximus]|uniref:Uncharacterized protein n=1 Tax=Scophthalmus maximus TaxID=52904 RepID=A0A2U9C8H5_SCOMX|nr:Hypothetical protein SMAX5B_018298 [Scophthalmus maximus]
MKVLVAFYSESDKRKCNVALRDRGEARVLRHSAPLCDNQLPLNLLSEHPSPEQHLEGPQLKVRRTPLQSELYHVAAR